MANHKTSLTSLETQAIADFASIDAGKGVDAYKMLAKARAIVAEARRCKSN